MPSRTVATACLPCRFRQTDTAHREARRRADQGAAGGIDDDTVVRERNADTRADRHRMVDCNRHHEQFADRRVQRVLDQASQVDGLAHGRLERRVLLLREPDRFGTYGELDVPIRQAAMRKGQPCASDLDFAMGRVAAGQASAYAIRVAHESGDEGVPRPLRRARVARPPARFSPCP